jgi:hypothetical protein
MKFAYYSLILSCLGLVFSSSGAFSSTESLDHFACSVSGYTPKTFELRRTEADFEIKASDISQNYRWYLEAGDCELAEQSPMPGLFSCKSSRPGTLEFQGKSLQYDKMNLRVSYQKRFVKVTQHQRVIDISFEGGDFDRPLILRWLVTVNFYNLNPGVTDAFNETCSVNGELIEQ